MVARLSSFRVLARTQSPTRGKIRAPGNFVTEFSADFRHEFPLRGKQPKHFAIFFGHARDNHIGVSQDFRQL